VISQQWASRIHLSNVLSVCWQTLPSSFVDSSRQSLHFVTCTRFTRPSAAVPRSDWCFL